MLWILHMCLNRPSRCHLDEQLDLCTSGVFSPIQNSSGDKCTFTSLLLASSITADLFLTFAKFHAETFSSSPHSLSTASLSLCAKSQWCSELSPFPPIWSSRILGSFLPYAVFGFHLLPIHMPFWGFVIILSNTGHPVPEFCPFARHSWSGLYFQFLPSILHDPRKFLVLWIDEMNTSWAFGHSRALVFHLPNYVSPSLSNFLTYFSRFRATNDQAWMWLDVSLISPRTTCILLDAFPALKVNWAKPVHVSDKSLEPWMF